jgi:NAD(P)-dependent dehydrogenase (short-subunit alcohol dehydrogenase family)
MGMKIALITGANRGLGLATARRLGEHGVTVLVGARDVVKADAAVRELAEAGIDAEPLTIDVTDAASVGAAAKEVDRRHDRLDILVNNAGILPEATAAEGVDGPLDLRMFESTFATNVFGVVSVTAAFLPLLERSEGGRVVNVSSTMGSLADQADPDSPYYGIVVPAYQTSKAALNSITIGLAKSLADSRIKVNSICPGWVQTDLGGPDNRAAAPLSADEGATIIAQMAQVDESGPSGRFVDTQGPVRW